MREYLNALYGELEMLRDYKVSVGKLLAYWKDSVRAEDMVCYNSRHLSVNDMKRYIHTVDEMNPHYTTRRKDFWEVEIPSNCPWCGRRLCHPLHPICLNYIAAVLRYL